MLSSFCIVVYFHFKGPTLHHWQINCGINFKYNYFIKEEALPSSDIIWRTGPEFSLSLPQTVNHDKQITVRDSWMRFTVTRPSVFTWDSWIEELPLKSLPAEGNISF